jgi:hypothetical protein
MLVPTPLLAAEEVRRITKGKLAAPSELRRRMAIRFGADQTCPLTTGILLHIVAGAAEEQLSAGHRPVAPYWRVVGEDGYLNPKIPPGPARQAEHLQKEGHEVRQVTPSRRWQVVGYRS